MPVHGLKPFADSSSTLLPDDGLRRAHDRKAKDGRDSLVYFSVSLVPGYALGEGRLVDREKL